MCDFVSGLISIVMPTFRRTKTLSRAISSVLSQTYGNLELIIVNDNGNDGPFTPLVKNIVQTFSADERIILLEPPEHRNGAYARNRGIRMAKGEFVAFLDDDDWWEPSKLSRQYNAFSNLSKEWGAVSCRIKRYDGDRFIALLPKYRDGFVYKDVMMLMSDFATGSLLIRHTCLNEIGGFDEHLDRHQDIQLLIQLTVRYKLLQLDEPLHCCDIQDGQNRPGSDELVFAKHALFSSVANVYNSLSPFEKRAVTLAHRAEIGRIRFKEGYRLKGTIDIAALMLSPVTLFKMVKKALCKAKAYAKSGKKGNK